MTYALQIAGKVLRDLVYVILLIVRQIVAYLIEQLLQLVNQLFRHFGEVLDEVEWVSDFVSDPGCQLAHLGQFLLGDDLVLGKPKFLQDALKLFIPLLQVRCQQLHQVQTLHLERVLSEHLEGGGHIRDLVVSADFDPGLQVAAGHATHPVRQHLYPAQ